MRKLLVNFLLLFINTGAVFAQNLSESEVKQACISDQKLSALTSNCHQNIDLTKNKKVQKACAQDIQYCSDKIICFLATVKRHGKRFWATSGNGSKYLKEASRRDLACGKLPPKLQEPPLSSDAPQSDSVALALEEALNAPRPETATSSSTSGLQMTSGEKKRNKTASKTVLDTRLRQSVCRYSRDFTLENVTRWQTCCGQSSDD